MTIGRDEQCALAIPDLALSRRHCEVTITEEGAVLRDLGSRNGCFVNGKPITHHLLADGDQIRIGDSAVLFTQRPAAATQPRAAPPAMDETPVPDAATVAIPAAESRYCQPVETAAALTGRAARDLALLLHLSDALQRASSREAAYAALLAHASDAVSADWVAILASDIGPDSVHVAASSPGCEGAVTISRTIATRAMSDRVAVMANDLHGDARFAEAASVAGSPDRAVICAPLLAPDHVAGALYLSRSTAGGPFTEDDLHLVAGFGSIGGLALDRLRHLEWLEGENDRLRRDAAIDHDLIGETPAMQAVYRFIARAAPTEATVLIRGESGTGKELVARAIHANSPRARGPFVAINCAALPEALLESELFGHERGAFTGAVAQQRGRLEMADRGTVFLDEVGELAPTLQAKLLRVLQDRTVEHIGGRRGVPIDVRVIAATNLDLEAAIKDGSFRQDLYYRLNVVSIEVPPLRERRDDLPLLAAYFVRKHAARCKRAVKGIAPEARARLLRHDWPGNVRELENAIERALVLGSTDVILTEDLPDALLEQAAADSPGDGFHERVAAHKRAVIQDALAQSGGNVTQAARLLGLQPTYLHRLIRNLGVRD